MLEAVYAYLDVRGLVGTELYVIGCEYVPVAVAVGVTDARRLRARCGARGGPRTRCDKSLWPLPPGGPGASGWPLGRAVRDRELEVVAAASGGV